MSAPDHDRDLGLIDAALAEGRASATDPRERQLEELALALRDESPRPDPAFERTLDQRVEEGFARPRRFRLPAIPRVRMLALAGAAALLLAVVTAVGVLREDGGAGGQQAAPSLAEGPASAPGPTTTGTTDYDAAPAQGGAAGAPAPARRVERSARMTLAAPGRRLQRVADGIGQVAESHRGFVLSSRFSTGDDSTRGGDFLLRVPTSELESALGELSKLGEVRSRSESSQDVTAPYRQTENRLGNLLLERRATADRLRGATGDEAERLRSRMRSLSAAIDELNDRMGDLRRRTVYSTVSVTLEERAGDGGAGGSGGGPGGAIEDTIDMLGDALGLAIRSLGVLLPLGLVGLLLWGTARTLRRRRREAALL